MLRAFPFRTFDEIAELGLAVEIYCPSCYRTVGPIDLADGRLRGRFFANTRFRCSQTRRIYDASPSRVCGCLGHIIVRPAPADFIPPHRSIAWCSITCPRCVPPLGSQPGCQALAAVGQDMDAARRAVGVPGMPIAIDHDLVWRRRQPLQRRQEARVTPLTSQVDSSGGELPGRKVDGRR